MQTVISKIYNEVALESELDPTIVKSIGDKCFQNLLKNFKKPLSLILKMRGLGYFYMRKNKLNEFLIKLDNSEERYNKEEFLQYETPVFIEHRKELKQVLLDRQLEYGRFIEKKQIIKSLRKPKENDYS